jgi:phage tail P2-like protein
MSIPIKESSLIDACPPSIGDDINVQAVCTALDRQFRELIDDINQTIILPAIDKITDHDLLDLLGWQFHVDYWDANQSVEIKQYLIKSSLDWHTRKGTVDLIQEVCDLAFGPGVATIQEWFDYKYPFPPNYPINDPITEDNPDGLGTWHDRYRFRVLFEENFVVDPVVENRVRELIRNYKPVTRWDEGFVRQRNSSLEIYWAAAALGWKYIFIEAPAIREPGTEPVIYGLFPPAAIENRSIRLRVSGVNFTPSAQIIWDGAPLPTTFINANNLETTSEFDVGPERIVQVQVIDNENQS